MSTSTHLLLSKNTLQRVLLDPLSSNLSVGPDWFEADLTGRVGQVETFSCRFDIERHAASHTEPLGRGAPLGSRSY